MLYLGCDATVLIKLKTNYYFVLFNYYMKICNFEAWDIGKSALVVNHSLFYNSNLRLFIKQWLTNNKN